MISKNLKAFSVFSACLVFAIMALGYIMTSCDTGSETVTPGCRIVFDSGEGEGPPPVSIIEAPGREVKLPDAGTMRHSGGKVLYGWKNSNRVYNVYATYVVSGKNGDVIEFTAQWRDPASTADLYTVSFDPGEGSGTTDPIVDVVAGNIITLPSQGRMTAPSGKQFNGWRSGGASYSAGDYFPVNANTVFIAQWKEAETNPTTPSNPSNPSEPSNPSNPNTPSNPSNPNEPSNPTTPGGIDSVTGLANKLAWLQTNAVSGGSYTIEVNANESIWGYLSYGKSNITITLRGTGSNRTISLPSNGTIFTIDSGVTLVLENNITLQGHSGNTSSLVQVNEGGILIMNMGSKITGNSGNITWAPGVYVSGTFTMNGGEISGNISSVSNAMGGGVCVSGTFTMNGGTISGNTAGNGGGVYIYGMAGSGRNNIFTMNGGTISGNTAGNGGGGGVSNDGIFDMRGGTISGNSTTWDGGGVSTSGVFTKTGGIITGNDASNANTASPSRNGHAIYAYMDIGPKWKNITSGSGDNLSSTRAGAFSGAWDN